MKTTRKPASTTESNGTVVVASDDGAVRFRLQPTPRGLWVQRVRCLSEPRARLVQSVVFQDADGFARWCDADSTRFDYPIVFSTVKREGDALLQDHDATPSASRDRQAS